MVLSIVVVDHNHATYEIKGRIVIFISHILPFFVLF